MYCGSNNNSVLSSPVPYAMTGPRSTILCETQKSTTVFMVAWSFRQYEGHTLASTSDFGSVITSMLKLNGFVVFRGGSTAAQRRRQQVLPELIRHMRETPAVAYGITCDGSQGPPYPDQARLRVDRTRLPQADAHDPDLVQADKRFKRALDVR